MKIKALSWFACLLLGTQFAICRDMEFTNGPVDESAMFSDSNFILDTSDRFDAHKNSLPEQKTVGISGSVITFGQTNLTRDYWSDFEANQASLASGLIGSALLDVRLPRGYRAMGDIEWNLDPNKKGDSAVAFRVPETFLDANINHKLWFRVGKQVLQWGRGWFFNPTDLINVERKSFLRRLGGREGVFGAKLQIPFGTTANLYAFLDGNGVTRPDSLSGAIKAEFLMGRTEFAFMAWDGGGRHPVYGADLSTRLLGLDITSEAALHQVFKVKSLKMVGGLPIILLEEKEWQSRLAFGLGRSFNLAGVPNRITTVAEYYYNQPGSKDHKMPFNDLIHQAVLAGFSQEQAFLAAASTGVYEPNSYSRHYAAFFATLNRFIRSELSLSFNAIGNLNQNCAMISTAISYRDLNDFGLMLSLNGFTGSSDKEYTLGRQSLQVQLIAEAAY